MTVARFSAKRLNQTEIEGLVAPVVRELSGLPGLKTMILFGSAVTGEMSEASDLDVVMIFETEDLARQASKVVHSLRREALWPMDILCVDRETYRQKRDVGGVYFVAHREGRLIYGEPS